MSANQKNTGDWGTLSSCICFSLCLLLWFLPGSFRYHYLESTGTGLHITSLFAFFPASLLLPLILAAASGWCLCQPPISRGMLWTILGTALLQCLYLGIIGAICLSCFSGDTFSWLRSLPFPLTLLGTGCFLFAFRNSVKKQNFFQK